MQIRDLIPEARWPWSSKDAAADKTGDATAETGAHPLATLQREMNRAFDSLWRGVEAPFGGALNATADVVETDKAVEVSMELPGLDEKDIDVSLTREALTIRGEKKIERQEEMRGVYLSERRYGAISRTIPLPSGVETDKAEAAFKNGVLTVTLPKSAEAQTTARKIPVSGA